MDVHKKSLTVYFKTDLFDNKTVAMPAEPSALISYVQKHFEDHEVSCCYEAGCCGYWIANNVNLFFVFRLLNKGFPLPKITGFINRRYSSIKPGFIEEEAIEQQERIKESKHITEEPCDGRECCVETRNKAFTPSLRTHTKAEIFALCTFHTLPMIKGSAC